MDIDLNRVAVIIPVYQSELTAEEEISLNHANYFLGKIPQTIVAPEGLQLPNVFTNSTVIRFEKRYFESTSGYSKLLLSKSFYEQFTDFEFILIYQLDCLVFSSEIEYWCNLGYDYIGAPWLKDHNNLERGFSRVGNGGLSLRRVDAFLKVLESRENPSFVKTLFRCRFPDKVDLTKRIRVIREMRRGIDWYAGNYSLNEDRFWSDRAKLIDSNFAIAPVETALKFSFEKAPKYCYESNGCQIPFGCHAWAKWDRMFWEPHLRKID